MAQSLAMRPTKKTHAERRDRGIRWWRDREPPQGSAFPGDPRNWAKTRHQRVKRTPLGEELLGCRGWSS